MARTRSKPAPKLSQGASGEAQAIPGKQLEPADTNPPKLFMLPKDAGKDARIITLPDPKTQSSNRYLACPQKGLYEFTQVAAPNSSPRSILLAPLRTRDQDDQSQEHEKEESDAIAKGYISSQPSLFIATPIDPLFLLLPVLAPSSTKGKKQLFVTLDDHLDNAHPSIRQLLRDKSYREMFAARLDGICDKVEAGDDSMYRLSFGKLAKVMVSKARRMLRNGLPASMEERFLRQALEPPILNVMREEANETRSAETPDETVRGAAAVESQSPPESQKDSQTSIFTDASATTSMTSVSSGSLPNSNHASELVRELLRLRTALSYMQSSYIPTHLHSQLDASIAAVVDFSDLNTHLAHLESLRKEAQALRALSDNITRKRGMEDDEQAEERAEKKRKKEEEDKKQKAESRATKQLKKVDTSGMKKLSSFFTKAPAKKA